MVFTNFEEFLGVRLDSGILEQWSNDLKLNEILLEIEDEIEEQEEDEE
jgi:nicotinic acid phosphoribosyltransferase